MEFEDNCFVFKRKKVYDPSKCAVANCRSAADGFTVTNKKGSHPNGHLFYLPVCEKCSARAARKPTPLRHIVQQRKGIEDLAAVLGHSPAEIQELLAEHGIDENGKSVVVNAPEVGDPGAIDMTVVASIPSVTVARIQEVHDECEHMLAMMEGFHIETGNKSQLEMTDALAKEVKVYWRELEDARKAAAKPLNDQKKAVQNHFKPTLDLLARVEVLLKGKIQDAHARAVAVQQAHFEAAQKAFDRGDVAQTALITQQAANASVELPAGTSVRTAIKWELVDIQQVPREYLMTVLNEALVQQAVTQGVRAIPGIRIYEEETLAMRTGR